MTLSLVAMFFITTDRCVLATVTYLAMFSCCCITRFSSQVAINLQCTDYTIGSRFAHEFGLKKISSLSRVPLHFCSTCPFYCLFLTLAVAEYGRSCNCVTMIPGYTDACGTSMTPQTQTNVICLSECVKSSLKLCLRQ